MKLREAVVAEMDAMVGSAARTAHAVLAPVAEREVRRKAVLFDFPFGRELNFRRSMRPCFTVLAIESAQRGVLTLTVLNQLGTYGCKTVALSRYLN